MDFLIELIGEFLFQLFFEILGAIFDGMFDASSRISRVLLKLLFYLILGAVLAVLSVAVWPQPLLGHAPNPLVSLLLVPLAVAFATVLISKLFERRWQWELATERFVYSYYFALVFAGCRYSLIF